MVLCRHISFASAKVASFAQPTKFFSPFFKKKTFFKQIS